MFISQELGNIWLSGGLAYKKLHQVWLLKKALEEIIN